MHHSTSKISLAFLLATTAVPAWAQTTPNAGNQASADPGEIVVTARRREESLSKVPIAISAIGAEQIANRSIQTEADLQTAVPGLTIRQNGSQNAFNYVIRGQTIDTYSNSPPGVLPYTNEAQVVTRSASAFYDLGGIQVLKGPQGTLFGRNVTGGAVLYQTARVTDDLEGYITGRYGNFEAYQVQGALNLPITQGVKLRVAGSRTGGGAFVRRTNTGEMIGNLEQRSIRGSLVLEPTSSLKNTTVVQHTRDRGTNTPGLAYRSSAYACGNGQYADSASCAYSPANPAFVAYLTAHPDVYKGGLTPFSNYQDGRSPWVADINLTPRHKAKSTFVINTTEFALNDQLTLKNILMLNKSSSDEKNDYDGTPYEIFSTVGVANAADSEQSAQQGFINRTKQLSNELQLQGKAAGDRLNYTLGLFYLNQTDDIDSNLSAFGFPPIVAPSVFAYRQRNKDKSVAVFGQATYALTDRLNVTAGYRHTWEHIRSRQLPGSLWTLFLPANNPTFPQSTKVNKPSWTFSVDYTLSNSLLVYATTRGSWRAGGFNYTLLPLDASTRDGGNIFGPESARDIEVGLKYNGVELGFPATLNIALYNQWVENIQRTANVIGFAGSPTLLTVNVPEAQVKGAEVDFSARPTDWLNLGGAVNYTDARFTKNKVAFSTTFSNNVLFYGPYADTPKWSGSAYAEVTHALGGDAGKVTLRADVFSQSEMYFGNLFATTAPGTDIDGYTLLNGRLTWSEMLGGPVTTSFFMRNILNEKYYTGGNATGPSIGNNVAFPGQPRMYGAEMKVTF